MLIVLSIFAFHIPSMISAQYNNSLISEGIEHIYRIEFDSAESKFNSFISRNPSEPEGHFFLAMVQWWKINIDKSDLSHDEEFLRRVDKVIEVSDIKLKRNKNDESALFFKGGAIGYRGLLRSVRDSWFKAASDGREALNLIEEANKVNPGNTDAVFGLGLYNYFADYVPELYPVLKPVMLLFPKGDKAKGLQQINQVAENTGYAKNEARYTLGYLYLRYEKNFFQAELNLRKLHDQFPNNPVFEKDLFSATFGLSKWQDSFDGWSKILLKAKDGLRGYDNKRTIRDGNYYCAVSLLKLGKYREAREYIEKAIEYGEEVEPGDSKFKSSLYLFAGEIYSNTGERSKAIEYIDKVLSMNNFDNIHDEARRIKSRL